ncbi:MAG: hypothetical protein ACRDNG_08040 [Gaiellaceae bacterium]
MGERLGARACHRRAGRDDENGAYRDEYGTVTFAAYDDSNPSRSTGDVPVTFWSGFLLADEQVCLPLDVWTDAASEPRRVEIELGRPC